MRFQKTDSGRAKIQLRQQGLSPEPATRRQNLHFRASFDKLRQLVSG